MQYHQQHRVEGGVQTLSIVGGGIMGAGLARYFLSQGLDVTVVEAEDRLAEKLWERLRDVFAKEVSRGRISEVSMAEYLECLSVTADLSRISHAEWVIEAVPEDLPLKREILVQIERAIQNQAVISTNTSAIPISALASALRRPGTLIGTHFFNPAQIMPLVEVVPGFDTAPRIVTRTLSFLESTGKKPVCVKECPGFLVNRILGAYMNEVHWALEDGAGIREIEKLTKDLGFPMGPITLGDMAGWDVICAANETLAAYYGERFTVPPLLKHLSKEGRHGMKSRKGLMDHTVQPPMATDDLVAASSPLNEEEQSQLKERLLGAIFAEALRCLDENVCEASDIDTAMRLGAGLPQGPLAWADALGLDRVLEQLKRLFDAFGPRFWPPPVLQIAVLAGYTGEAAGRGLGGVYRSVDAR